VLEGEETKSGVIIQTVKALLEESESSGHQITLSCVVHINQSILDLVPDVSRSIESMEDFETY
jgi:hypothetical protein